MDKIQEELYAVPNMYELKSNYVDKKEYKKDRKLDVSFHEAILKEVNDNEKTYEKNLKAQKIFNKQVNKKFKKLNEIYEIDMEIIDSRINAQGSSLHNLENMFSRLRRQHLQMLGMIIGLVFCIIGLLGLYIWGR